jgi:hypothetical protein
MGRILFKRHLNYEAWVNRHFQFRFIKGVNNQKVNVVIQGNAELVPPFGLSLSKPFASYLFVRSAFRQAERERTCSA